MDATLLLKHNKYKDDSDLSFSQMEIRFGLNLVSNYSTRLTIMFNFGQGGAHEHRCCCFVLHTVVQTVCHSLHDDGRMGQRKIS